MVEFDRIMEYANPTLRLRNESGFNRREFLGSAPALAALMRPERVLGANDRIGMAVIGCGGRGLLKEALQFAEESNLDIVAVCDTWRERREAAALRHVKCETSAKNPF